MPDGALYVGRPSRWGNPFRIYHGHALMGPSWTRARETWRHLPADQCVNGYITSSRALGPEEAVRAFSDLLAVRRRDEPERLAKWLALLRGRDLACWCPLVDPSGNLVPCHADVLLRIANEGGR
jgi:hypothetical protein